MCSRIRRHARPSQLCLFGMAHKTGSWVKSWVKPLVPNEIVSNQAKKGKVWRTPCPPLFTAKQSLRCINGCSPQISPQLALSYIRIQSCGCPQVPRPYEVVRISFWTGTIWSDRRGCG